MAEIVKQISVGPETQGTFLVLYRESPQDVWSACYELFESPQKAETEINKMEDGTEALIIDLGKLPEPKRDE